MILNTVKCFLPIDHLLGVLAGFLWTFALGLAILHMPLPSGRIEV
jgi:hypothetical protein